MESIRFLFLDLSIQAFGCFAAMFILGSNIIAVKTVYKSLKDTFLNLLISLDCCIGICITPVNIIMSVEALIPSSSPEVCTLMTMSSYFLTMMNGLLPVGIVLFRVFHVCYPRRVMTAVQRKNLNYTILFLTLGVSVVLTGVALNYKDDYSHYRRCIKKDHDGSVWALPVFHPFRLASIVAFLARTIFVPIG